jgi:serine protease Do
VLPTVVTIKTAASPRSELGTGSRENPFQGTPWEDLFEGGAGPRVIPRREGLGSGVIIDSQGVILTNNHVVAESDRVLVELSDGREYAAQEIHTDPETDLAVVRINPAEPLPAAVLGDSDALQIGDWVLAVGSPFGLEATVSAGIISAKGRSLSAAQRAQFLQTDAAINPGNSGGPLVNLRGEVVGINSAIASRTGAYQGIGFAVPANLAKWVSGQLVRDGRVKRSYLGVGVVAVTAELAEQMGVGVGQGVVVMNVYPGSPADKAGLRLGDIVTKFEKAPINTPPDLQQAVEKLSVGSQAQLTYLRDSREQTVSVQLEELPASEGRAEGGANGAQRRFQPKTNAEAVIGMEVQDLDARVARELGYEDRTTGVLVSWVDPNGMAGEKGIIRGMLILRVGKTDVLNVDQFRQAIAEESLEKGILLLVATPAENRFVVLKKY